MANTLTVVANLSVAFAALWGACIAHRGLNTWRSQIAGAKRHELAFELWKAATHLHSAIEGALSPLRSQPSNLYVQEGTPPQEIRAEKEFHSVIEGEKIHYNLLHDAILGCSKIRPEVRIVLQPVAEDLDKLLECAREARTLVSRYIRTLKPDADNLERSDVFRNKVNADLSGDGPDSAKELIARAACLVEKIETTLKPLFQVYYGQK